MTLDNLTFNDIECRNLSFNEPHGTDEVNNPEDYTLFDRTKHFTTSDHKKTYSDFQWMLALIMEKSDKVYVIDPNNIQYRHFLGKTLNYFSYFITCFSYKYFF